MFSSLSSLSQVCVCVSVCVSPSDSIISIILIIIPRRTKAQKWVTDLMDCITTHTGHCSRDAQSPWRPASHHHILFIFIFITHTDQRFAFGDSERVCVCVCDWKESDGDQPSHTQHRCVSSSVPRSVSIIMCVSSGRVRASVSVLLACLVLQACGAPEPDRDTCYSRQHRDVAVNTRAALGQQGTVMEALAKPSEKDCILTCCSEDLRTGVKCNLVVYNPPARPGDQNCLLFHCESETDCPLTPASAGINTYDIFKGENDNSRSLCVQFKG
ncbi:hypothetical protein F2P79_021122 [Pimephales promelas]|nr:hypothetical protein F2P79_021122 [Pimephales promelas]